MNRKRTEAGADREVSSSNGSGVYKFKTTNVHNIILGGASVTMTLGFVLVEPLGSLVIAFRLATHGMMKNGATTHSQPVTCLVLRDL